MSHGGWIKLHRKALESSVFDNAETWRVWCWCLMKASHEGNKFAFNGKDMDIPPGSFVTGRARAIYEMKGLTAQKYRSALLYLVETTRITIKTTNKFSLIQINKWSEFQTDNQQITNKQPTNNQQITTIKNDKNVKKEKNTEGEGENSLTLVTPKSEAASFFQSSHEPTVSYLVEKGMPREIAEREIAKFISYWTEPNATGSKQRWQMEKTFEVKRRLLTWMTNAFTFNKSKGSNEPKGITL